MMTGVFPVSSAPLVGETFLTTTGVSCRYLKRSPGSVALVPPSVVTVTSSVAPGVPAGETAVIEFAELTMRSVALAVPKWTAVAPSRLSR